MNGYCLVTVNNLELVENLKGDETEWFRGRDIERLLELIENLKGDETKWFRVRDIERLRAIQWPETGSDAEQQLQYQDQLRVYSAFRINWDPITIEYLFHTLTIDIVGLMANECDGYKERIYKTIGVIERALQIAAKE